MAGVQRDPIMMANRLPKSYVLPSMGLIMISVPRADPETHRILVENASPSGNRSLYTQTLLKHCAGHPSTTYVHEWGHIIQNVAYPYLYLRNIRELYFINSLLSEFLDDIRPSIPRNWTFNREAFDCLTMDVRLFRIMVGDDGTVGIDPPGKGERERNEISEVDLIEEANSIFEFKVEIGNYGTGDEYHNWLKKGTRAYTRVYRLLSKYLGRQDAYDLLPVLVVASYHTTYPVAAFASLLGHVLRYPEELDTADPTENQSYLVGRLSCCPGIESQEIPELRRPLTEDPFAFVGEEAMRRYIEQNEGHPLTLLARRVWVDRSSVERGWIYYPHKYVGGLMSVRDEIHDLMPPFMYLVYDSADVPMSAVVFLISDLYQGKKVSKLVDPLGQTGFHAYLDTLLARRVLAQGLYHDPKNPRLNYCPHEECAYFNSGLCDEYIRIPDKASDCTFPKYMADVIRRRYSKESNSLERMESNGTERPADRSKP
jgi:hypothetical protein